MRRRDLIALSPLCLLSACSSTPEPKPIAKPPEPVTGLHGLYGMYQQARLWSADVLVVSCQSIAISQIKPQPGKAPAWQAVFAAPALKQKRAYTFSVFDASTSLRQGIFPDGPTPLETDTRPFLLAGARVDTDVAWDTAQKRGEEFSKKYPDMPISFTLELSRTINEPVWRVIWGENVTSSQFSIVIDASTGQYVQTLH